MVRKSKKYFLRREVSGGWRFRKVLLIHRSLSFKLKNFLVIKVENRVGLTDTNLLPQSIPPLKPISSSFDSKFRNSGSPLNLVCLPVNPWTLHHPYWLWLGWWLLYPESEVNPLPRVGSIRVSTPQRFEEEESDSTQDVGLRRWPSFLLLHRRT